VKLSLNTGSMASRFSIFLELSRYIDEKNVIEEIVVTCEI
jgi:hypothetical protein